MTRTEVKQKVYEAILHASRAVGEREKGHNAGPFVTKVLAAAGLGPGFPWCASFVRWSLDSVGLRHVGPRKGSAAVRNWAAWATQNTKTLNIEEVVKGDLFFWLNDNQTGHIGWVIDAYFSKSAQCWFISTIEGNTNDGGSREGDGVYRRQRKVTPNIRFMRLWWYDQK